MTPFPGDGPTTIFGSTDADDSDGRGPLQYHEARGRTEGQLDDDEEWESDVRTGPLARPFACSRAPLTS